MAVPHEIFRDADRCEKSRAMITQLYHKPGSLSTLTLKKHTDMLLI